MENKIITSLTNARVKNVVALRQRSTRVKSGLTIVEGKREIAHALKAGIKFQELYFNQEQFNRREVGDFVATRSNDLTIYETSNDVFTKMSYGDRKDGLLAVCSFAPLKLSKLPEKKNPLYVVVECVEKPGNLGAILRSCDGAGVDAIIVCDGKTDVTNPNVIRASLGTVFTQKVVVSSNEETLQFLESKQVRICAALPEAKTIYTKKKYNSAVALIVGSEQNGLTPFWQKVADCKIQIPMKGMADSLNVSVSTAIILYEIIRQRSK